MSTALADTVAAGNLLEQLAALSTEDVLAWLERIQDAERLAKAVLREKKRRGRRNAHETAYSRA
ncbi:MAG TPA: hypothetical protein VMG10_32830 [Gemmataceae bacterium]|nr:hypothetical protein [Gemmataceae bacterium]